MIDKPLDQESDNQQYSDDIAIIAMVCRFPDANDYETFWHNLRDGVESVKSRSIDSIKGGGLDQFIDDDPSFVYAEAALDKALLQNFDAEFFNMSSKEARIMDPQHRLFLEGCWQLFEASGYSVEHYDGRVGVFGSAAYSGYIENFSPELMQQVGIFQTQLANDKDFLATRVAYKMNFNGPAINVNTLCSSSAVALHLARESLLNFQIDYGIAGGVNISVAESGTSYYHEGGIGADEGHCRAYDHNASGTVAGNGMAIIALKRLDDALTDGDQIHAIVKGTAVNNDGADKASYTAPSPQGQAECIAECLNIADVSADTIEFIDGHGTGTYIGDPIEISGLTQAYRQHTDKKQYCGIGSVKTNIGHLVTAGGMASLLKVVLALKHQQMPPSLNFDKENPKIDFANSPFYVNHQLKPWQAKDHPRRGAVSSFGIGGTNVHIILQEAPKLQPTAVTQAPQLLLLSAKTATALAHMKLNLAEYLNNHPQANLADVAYTLQVGRNSFEHRYGVVVSPNDDHQQQLLAAGGLSRQQKQIERPVVMVFHQGDGVDDNAIDQLSRHYAVFAAEIAQCQQAAAGKGLLPEQLNRFSYQYALFKLYQSFGISPSFIVNGGGVGHFVTACASGALSLADALDCLCGNDLKAFGIQSPSVRIVCADSAKWLDQISDDYWQDAQSLAGPSQLEQAIDLALDTNGVVMAVGQLAADFSIQLDDSQLLLNQAVDDRDDLLKLLAQLWLVGVKPNWSAIDGRDDAKRLQLPTYPFERTPHWIERRRRLTDGFTADAQMANLDDLAAQTEAYEVRSFYKGHIGINIQWSEDPQLQYKQMIAVMQLKQQLEQTCADITANEQISLSVTPLGLQQHADPLKASSSSEAKASGVKPRPDLDTPYVEPQSQVAQQICEIWASALGQEKVGIHDNFFDLGGDSLIASVLVNQLKHKHKIELGLRELLATPTVAQLAEMVENRQWAKTQQSQADGETLVL